MANSEEMKDIREAIEAVATAIDDATTYEGAYGVKSVDSLYNMELQLGFIDDKLGHINDHMAIMNDHLEDIANALKMIANK
jgi:hypothetical protein